MTRRDRVRRPRTLVPGSAAGLGTMGTSPASLGSLSLTPTSPGTFPSGERSDAQSWCPRADGTTHRGRIKGLGRL